MNCSGNGRSKQVSIVFLFQFCFCGVKSAPSIIGKKATRTMRYNCLGATSRANSIAIQILFCFDLTRENRCRLRVLKNVFWQFCSMSGRPSTSGTVLCLRGVSYKAI